MKQSAILDIFHGVRGTTNHMRVSPEEKIVLEKVEEAHEKLCHAITAEQKALLDDYVKYLEEIYRLETDVVYTEAFKLGLQIGVECMKD